MEYELLDPDDHQDEPGLWLDQTSSQPHPVPSRKRLTGSSILMAAMLGVVEALGWERPKEETVEIADAPKGDDGLDIDYRHLEPLD